ncbi:SURF1-like protein [Brevundimonas denitrificans]|uniref:SURF1-like protein n=1 Tax=Brevundimonas denitrificans TaxID=1443434 RepID=A0ABQ6BGG6_9CAUL|nr:SURF1 family protein [Brevundimonas denitrificans]GLS00499.1 SURF1-like protein [Brevundimonas denitrificans]
MTAEATRARFPVLLTLAAALAFALLCGLGVWQVQRMQWKNGLIDRAEAAAATPPAPLASVMALHDPAFRKVAVDCPGLATAPYVELQTIHAGEPGVRLISVCRPAGFPAVFLIDRGFVAETISARPPVAASTESFSLVAEVRETPPPGPMALPVDEGRFFARDTPAMARALGVADPDPNTLFALTSSNPEWEALQPSAPPAAFSNNHLGYALTWFGLALALAVFYVVLLRRRLTS